MKQCRPIWAVLEAATRLLAARPGASTGEIAAAASISRASLHRLFPTRDALLDEIAAVAAERVTAAIATARLDDGPLPAALTRLTEAIVAAVDQFAYLTAEMDHRRWERFREQDQQVDDVFTQFFGRAQAEGVVRADLPVAWLVRSYGWLLYAAWVAVRRGEIAPRDAARLVLSTFLGGAAAPTAAGR